MQLHSEKSVMTLSKAFVKCLVYLQTVMTTIIHNYVYIVYGQLIGRLKSKMKFKYHRRLSTLKLTWQSLINCLLDCHIDFHRRL